MLGLGMGRKGVAQAGNRFAIYEYIRRAGENRGGRETLMV
jgi:hypothetical protein